MIDKILNPDVILDAVDNAKGSDLMQEGFFYKDSMWYISTNNTADYYLKEDNIIDSDYNNSTIYNSSSKMPASNEGFVYKSFRVLYLSGKQF